MSDDSDNDDTGITCLAVLSDTQVYPVSVVCVDTGLSHNYQSIYVVMCQRKITSQSCFAIPPA